MIGPEGGPEVPAQGVKTAHSPEATIDEVAGRIEKFVATNCGSHPYQVLAAALKRAATNWEIAPVIAAPKEGSYMDLDKQSGPSSGVADTETIMPPLSGPSGVGIHSQDASVWVFVAAFSGLAIAWATGGVAPWLGALIGGMVAYLIAGLVLASRG